MAYKSHDPAWLRQQRATGQTFERPRVIELMEAYEDAVAEYAKYRDATGVRGRRLLAETLEWFDSPDESWPFSFRNICAALDLDASWVRRWLEQGEEYHDATPS